jgi:formylglycine-generating enzyme required for sulfatase activity
MSAIRREADCTYVVNSEDEWYKAAFHKNDGDTDNYWLYQTACDTVPSNLLVNPDPGNNATFAGCNTAPYYHTEVGEHENSASSYGTFDQGGNVFEWIETNSGSLAIRGGSYYYGTNWFGERYTTTTGEFGDRGFRVALIPEPATLSLLGIGGLAVLRRRHH